MRMTKGADGIQFPRGYEKSTRNRLGLGQVREISIDSALELANVHNYNWYQWDYKHWAFDSFANYSIHTGMCKSGWYTQNFDIGVDADGMVTYIVESRGYPSDFGLYDFVSKLLKWDFKKKPNGIVTDDYPKKIVKFPNGKETQIRRVLGLADSDCFRRSDILKLAKLHGYKEDSGASKPGHSFRIHPSFAGHEAFKPGLDLAIDYEEAVTSIVAIS